MIRTVPSSGRVTSAPFKGSNTLSRRVAAAALSRHQPSGTRSHHIGYIHEQHHILRLLGGVHDLSARWLSRPSYLASRPDEKTKPIHRGSVRRIHRLGHTLSHQSGHPGDAEVVEPAMLTA